MFISYVRKSTHKEENFFFLKLHNCVLIKGGVPESTWNQEEMGLDPSDIF